MIDMKFWRDTEDLIEKNPDQVITNISDYLEKGPLGQSADALNKAVDLVSPTAVRSGLSAQALGQAANNTVALGSAVDYGAAASSNTERELRRNQKKGKLLTKQIGGSMTATASSINRA